MKDILLEIRKSLNWHLVRAEKEHKNPFEKTRNSEYFDGKVVGIGIAIGEIDSRLKEIV